MHSLRHVHIEGWNPTIIIATQPHRKLAFRRLLAIVFTPVGYLRLWFLSGRILQRICRLDRGVDASHVKVALRERYLDASFPQGFSHARRDVALQLKPTFLPRRPKAELEVQGAIAKAHEEGGRFGVLHNSGIRSRYLDEQIDNLFGVRAVRYSNRYFHAPPGRRQSPIDNLIRDQVAVGHNYFRTLVSLHRTRASSYPFDRTDQAVDVYSIADTDRPLEQQD